MPFFVRKDGPTTEIMELSDEAFQAGEEKFATYEEARADAIEYLEYVVSECQEMLENLRNDNETEDEAFGFKKNLLVLRS